MRNWNISSPTAIAKNIAWLLGDKLSKLVLGVFVYGWVGRYLGPAEFGKINYAVALSTVAFGFASLGLSAVVVKELIRNPDNKQNVLTSALFVQGISGLLTATALCFTALFLNEKDLDSRLIIIIMSLPLSLKLSDTVRSWLEANLQSRISVLIDNGVFFVCALAKIAAIRLEFSAIELALIFALEGILTSAIHILYYTNKHGFPSWQFVDPHSIWHLLKQGAPLIISSIAFLLYSKIDQIMIDAIIGAEAVGIYSASTKIAEAIFFIPAILVTSLYPSVELKRSLSKRDYQRALQHLYGIATLVAILSATAVSTFSRDIILIVYGSSYEAAAQILTVYSWSGVFVALATASGRYFISENMQHLTMYRHAVGALLNIFLNFLTIPRYGAIGAAYASVISFFVANFLFDATTSRTRFCFQQKVVALLIIPSLITLTNDIVRVIKKK